ncbi:MAG: TetR/AcrR family transcriptional regulator [Chloroflexi bacterium]|nr:TetR/AcrR family transcriptional regulator [Chloroflexota bacterium]
MATPSSTTKPPRRTAILNTAYELFSRQGYHGTSIRQIARRNQVALSTIYYYFGSKENLFASVYEHFHPAPLLLERLQGRTYQSREDLLRHAWQALMDFLEASPEFIHIMFIEWVEFQGRHAPYVWTRFLPQWRALLEPVFGQGLSDTDLLALFGSLIGYAFGYVIARQNQRYPASKERLLQLFLHGATSLGA